MTDDDLIVVGPDDPQVAAGNPGGTRRVTVSARVQVVNEGTVYLPGDTAIVPEALAEAWIKARWVNDAD